MAASPMIGRSSSPSCVKCGSPMPVGAAFCSNCGTQIGDSSFSSDHGDPEKPLTDTNNPGSGHFDPLAVAETINPTALVTSMDSPSPRPPVRPEDGPFQ